MGFWELVVLAVGLSMDAFAVSICKGLALQRVSWKECCIAGLWFGGFQALMPLLGYLLGTQFEQFVTSVDHWIAFVLLGIIGSITFVFSAAGIRLGNVFGLRYKRKAEFAGGVILILLGTKILLEHLGVL